MNWLTVSFDWNQARAFLVTAEEGSLSAAARALGLTQPTLSRQVAALEGELGVILFERVGRSLSPTKSGLELLDHVRKMGEAAGQVSLTASGNSQTVEGQVCITATDLMAAYFLPPVLKQLQKEAPGIEIELVVSNEMRDLLRREADIAIRHVPSTQPDLISKLIGECSAHLYASSEYLDRHGRPQSASDLSDASLIGFGNNDQLIKELNTLGLPLTTRNIKLNSANSMVVWEYVKQGLGICIMAKHVADQTPGIEQILPETDPLIVPVWLVTHRELHTSRRIRLVFDMLEETLPRDRQNIKS